MEDWWKENFMISRRTFEYIVRVVGPDLTKRDTRLRQCIHVNKRVAVALWRLATGDTYRSTGLQFGIGRCTAMLITHDFCEAIAKRATEFIKFPVTEQEVLQSIRLFTRVVTWYMGSGLKAQNMTGIRAQRKGLRTQKNGIRDHKAFEPESGIRFITRSKNLLSQYFSA